jgi:hypothetical protein
MIIDDARSASSGSTVDARAPGGDVLELIVTGRRYTKDNPTELDLLKDALEWYDLSIENGSDKGPMVATLAKAARAYMLGLKTLGARAQPLPPHSPYLCSALSQDARPFKASKAGPPPSHHLKPCPSQPMASMPWRPPQRPMWVIAHQSPCLPAVRSASCRRSSRPCRMGVWRGMRWRRSWRRIQASLDPRPW